LLSIPARPLRYFLEPASSVTRITSSPPETCIESQRGNAIVHELCVRRTIA
jgi:hypothetical protein